MGITVAQLQAEIRAEGASSAVAQVKKLGVVGDQTSEKLVAGNEATSRSFKNMVRNAAVVAGSLYAIKKASDVAFSAIGTAQDFEAAISDLSAITGATGKDLEYLAKKSREFGASTTLSATQAAEAFKLIASAKPDLLDNAEALSKVTKEAITLAEASGSTLPEAAATLGSALNQFGADADQAGRFINVLAAGAKFGASEIADTANALRDSGTVAASANVSFEELNAGIQALSTVSIKGSRAGVGLRNVILKLQKEGIDSLNPSVVGLTGAMKNLAAQNLDTTKLIELFGLENVTAAKALIANADNLGKLTTKLTGTSTAYEQARIKVNNLAGDTKQLNSAWEEFQLTLVGSTDSLRGVVQGATSGVKYLTGSMDELAIAGAGVSSILAGQLSKAVASYAVSTVKAVAAQRAATLATVENAKVTTASLAVKASYAAAEVKEAQAAVLAASGVQRLTVAQNVLVPAQLRAKAAADAHTASLARLAVATRSASLVAGGLRGVMALLGGPVGIIVTAASALAFWAVTADDAASSTSEAATSVGDLAKNLTAFDLAGSIKSTRDQIKVYQHAIEQIKDTTPGDAGAARVASLEQLIAASKVKLADLGVQLTDLKAKEKEISDIASGSQNKPAAATSTKNTFDEDARKQVDALQKSLLTQKQLVEENYLDRLFIAESAFDDETIKAAEHSQLLVDIEKQKNAQLADLTEKKIKLEENIKVRGRDTESEALASRVQAIAESQLTEEEMLIAARDRKVLLVEQWISEDFSRAKRGDDIILGIHKKTKEAEVALQKSKQQSQLSLASNFLGAFAALAQAGGEKSFRTYKNLAIAETIVSTYAAAQKAYESQLIPGDPSSVYRGYAAAAAATAGGLARLISIKNASVGGGGSIASSGGGGGGGSTAGGGTENNSGVGVNQNFIPSAAQRPTSERDRGSLTVIFQGDQIGWDEHIQERVIGGIRDLVDNQDVILISNNSRNASDLATLATTGA